LRVVDPGTGLVVIDSRVAEGPLMKAGPQHPVIADDGDFYGRQDMFSARSGTGTIGSEHLSFAALSTDLESGIDAWVVVASAPVVVAGVAAYVWAMLALGLALLSLGTVLTVAQLKQRRRAAAQA